MVPGSFHKLTEEYPVLTKLTYMCIICTYITKYGMSLTTLPVVHNFICVQLLYQLYPPIPMHVLL